jgi:hypothetical protein
MTDAASAPTLNDVWNLFVVVADREPIQLRIFVVLVALVIVVLVIDGIRANLEKAKPQTLHVIREGFGPTRAPRGNMPRVTQPPTLVLRVKKAAKKPSPFKPARPLINRLPGGNSENSTEYHLRPDTRENADRPL